MAKPTIAQIRNVARAICRVAAGVQCVMDEHPERPSCTTKNCHMMRVAQDALHYAERERVTKRMVDIARNAQAKQGAA